MKKFVFVFLVVSLLTAAAASLLLLDDANTCQNYGHVYRNIFGDVYLCQEGKWILQKLDSGVLVQDGVTYLRADPIPGTVPETFRFSHWAGELYLDKELGAMARVACYFTANGLGCDIRYKILDA